MGMGSMGQCGRGIIGAEVYAWCRGIRLDERIIGAEVYAYI